MGDAAAMAPGPRPAVDAQQYKASEVSERTLELADQGDGIFAFAIDIEAIA